jgi:sulfite exporter TauE/SafE
VDGGLLLSLLLLGAASGVHCVGMCGGIVGAFSLRRTVFPRRELVARQVLFNLGRISTYAALGAVGGLAGQLLLSFTQMQIVLQVLASLVLILAGLHLATGGRWLAPLESLGAPLWRRVQPLAARLAGAPGPGAAYGAGLAWGALPCGLVYAALAAAAFAGTPLGGAAAMLAFGLGTAPWLLAAGFTAARLRGWLARPLARAAAGGTVLAFGAWGLAHAGEAAAGLGNFLCL